MMKKSLCRIFVGIPLGLAAASVLLAALLKIVPVYYTPLMLRRAIEHRGDGSYSRRHKWVRLEDISPDLVMAVIASEDNRFDTHRGFDFEEMRKMREAHRKSGAKIRGCSTISQQTAKNVFTFGSPTLARKAAEAYWTFLIERIWGKKRIMEVYLNVIETGPGIYGAEASAQTFYSKPASGLSLSESAMLAAVLPAPLKRDVSMPTDYLLRRRNAIMSLSRKVPRPGWIDQ